MRKHTISRSFLGGVGVSAFALLILSWSRQAGAYSYNGHHWDFGNPTYVDYNVLSGVPLDWTASIARGAAAWNSAGARFRFRYGWAGHTIGYRSLDYRINAVTYIPSGEGTRVTDRDTDFNSRLSWSTTGSPTGVDVQSIAAHEFGHWLTLLDLYDYGSDRWKTMYGNTGPGETFQRTLESDDSNGIRAIYGT